LNLRSTYWVIKLTPTALILMLGLLLTANVANATEEYSPPPPKQHQHQGQGQVQLQGQKQKLNAKQSTNVDVNTLNKSSVRVNTGDVAVETGDVLNKNQNTATVEKGAVDVRVDGTTVDARTDLNVTGDRVTYEDKRDAPDVTFIPNNNTAGCRYVIGITGVGVNGGGGLGWPLKDKDCIFMEFAAMAFSQGNTDGGWDMYCSAPTIKREMGTKKGRWIFARYSGGKDACLALFRDNALQVTIIEKTQTIERLQRELTESQKNTQTTVTPACETHPHVENERGYMEYDGRTYVNVDKAFAKESDVAALCGVDS